MEAAEPEAVTEEESGEAVEGKAAETSAEEPAEAQAAEVEEEVASATVSERAGAAVKAEAEAGAEQAAVGSAPDAERVGSSEPPGRAPAKAREQANPGPCHGAALRGPGGRDRAVAEPAEAHAHLGRSAVSPDERAARAALDRVWTPEVGERENSSSLSVWTTFARAAPSTPCSEHRRRPRQGAARP